MLQPYSKILDLAGKGVKDKCSSLFGFLINGNENSCTTLTLKKVFQLWYKLQVFKTFFSSALLMVFDPGKPPSLTCEY
jgi:hypothetical protein